jgi:hypothetical protein
MFCSNCGNPLAENANFCNKCGLKAARNEHVQPGYPSKNSHKATTRQPSKPQSNWISLLGYAIIVFTALYLLYQLIKPTPRWDLCDCLDARKVLYDENGKLISSMKEAESRKKERDKACKWIDEEMTPDDVLFRSLQLCK